MIGFGRLGFRWLVGAVFLLALVQSIEAGPAAVASEVPATPAAKTDYPHPLDWKEGHYVDYLMEWKDGGWEAVGLSLARAPKKSGDPWLMLVRVKRPELQFEMALEAKEPVAGDFGGVLNLNSVRMRPAVSFGLNTLNISAFDGFPAFVDFGNPREIRHSGFRLTYPAAWFVRPFEGSRPQSKGLTREVHMGNMGGNIHAAYMLVSIHRGKPADVVALHQTLISQSGDANNQSGGGEFTLLEPVRRAKLAAGEQSVFLQGYRSAGQTGFRVVSVLLAPDQSALAEVTVFSNFSSSNPHRAKLGEFMKAAVSYASSFRFDR